MTINQTLNANQKLLLSSIGDNIGNATYSTAVQDSFSIGKVLYKKIDTIIGLSKKQSIYVYEPRNLSNLYAISFYDKGQGNGDYILDSTFQVNGKVFKWIAPDQNTGKKKGRYDPDVQLVTPKSQELYSLSTIWNLNSKTNLNADVALSKYDINTFSSKDKQNDLGAGFKLYFENTMPLQSTKTLSIHTQINTEYASLNFKPVERLRSVEFMRDWGLDFIPAKAEEKIVSALVGIEDKGQTYLKYGFLKYKRDNNYDAYRHQFDQVIHQNNWKLNNMLSVTKFSDLLRSGNFFRPTIQIEKIFPTLMNQSFGLQYLKESSVARNIVSNEITANSFSFETFQLYSNSDPLKENKWGFKYFTRLDEMPFGSLMKKTDRSNNYSLQYEWMSNDHHQLRSSINFRDLQYMEGSSSNKNENSLLGRVEYFAKYWKGAINGNSLYELGSGQEPRKTFSFFEVPVGQGEYTWIDYNNDGVQQLNEFEVAKFRDQAKYFKIFTPTTEYIKSNYLQFNYNFIIDPSIALTSQSSLHKFLRRLYFQSSIQVNEKKYAAFGRIYNPFKKSIFDTSFVSSDHIVAQSFSFNKYSQIWGIDLNYLENTGQAFLSYGPESRRFSDLTAKARANIKRRVTLDLISRHTIQQLTTPAFSNRNYKINSVSYEPRLIYTQNTNWRVAGSLKFENKTNIDIQKANIRSFIIDGKYNLVSNTSLNVKINFSSIEFNGNPNSTVGYIMMDGLKPGSNSV